MSNDAAVRTPHHASLVFSALVVMGYGLFRSANSSIYLSHFSQTDGSFIFMTDATFNMASAFATAVCALAIVLLRVPLKTCRGFPCPCGLPPPF